MEPVFRARIFLLGLGKTLVNNTISGFLADPDTEALGFKRV